MAAWLAQAQAPVFRARTELVQLDVVVVDDKGRAIVGLTKDDFEILDKGRPQRVATSEEVAHAKKATSLFPPDVRRDVADNLASAADRLIVVIMDDLHFQEKTDRTRAMARRVVEEIGDGAAIALVTTSGSFGMEPTTDRAQVLAEIDRFVDRFDPEGRRTVFGEVTASNPGPLRNAMGERVAVRGPSDPASFFGNVGGYKTLEGVAKKIASDPSRRKAFVWISGGMPGVPSMAACERSESVFCNLLASLVDALRKANVAAYPIATGDFKGPVLREIAADSGGFVTEASQFEQQLPRLVAELDHYYVLGFYPEPPDQKGFHKIDVRVRRAGASVRHRYGYNADRTVRARSKSELARLAEGSLPVGGLPLKLHAVAAPAVGKTRARTLIALEVEPPAGVRDADDRTDTLRYEVWAVDLAKKKVASSVAREARGITVDAKYQVHTMLMLKPGRYQLRAAASSATLAKGASVFQEIVVPDYEKSALEIGPIAVAYADGQRVPVVRGGLGAGLFPLAVTLDREFSVVDKLRVVSDIVQRTKDVVDVEVDLFTAAGDRARRLLAKSLQPADARTLDIALDLEGLSTGGYRLRIRARAPAASSERELPFVVR